MTQFMTAAEQVEEGHRRRGEPTYAELKQQRDELRAMLDYILREHLADCYQGCPYCDGGYALIDKTQSGIN